MREYQNRGINNKLSTLYLYPVSVFLLLPPLIKTKISTEAHHLRENEEEVGEEEDEDKEKLNAKITSRYIKNLSIKTVDITRLTEIISE